MESVSSTSVIGGSVPAALATSSGLKNQTIIVRTAHPANATGVTSSRQRSSKEPRHDTELIVALSTSAATSPDASVAVANASELVKQLIVVVVSVPDRAVDALSLVFPASSRRTRVPRETEELILATLGAGNLLVSSVVPRLVPALRSASKARFLAVPKVVRFATKLDIRLGGTGGRDRRPCGMADGRGTHTTATSVLRWPGRQLLRNCSVRLSHRTCDVWCLTNC